MANYTDDQLADMREAFKLLDKVGDDKIDSADLGTCLRALGKNPTEAEVKAIISENGDKRHTFEEVLSYLPRVKRDLGTKEEFVEGLKIFDKEGNGTMSTAELRHILTSLGEQLTDKEVDHLFNNIEIGKDGEVNYRDFVNLVMSG
eukprot:Clim_evm41s218 gene=Clim_evmTU41s218